MPIPVRLSFRALVLVGIVALVALAAVPAAQAPKVEPATLVLQIGRAHV